MRARAIRDLCQLRDDAFFAQISVGLEHIVQNAMRVEDDAHILLQENRPQGYRILRGVAEEEAAKFLILLDAVRCPRDLPKILSRQLGYSISHLARGIYVEYYGWRPATFGQIKPVIANELRQFYLDGPNDVDWIFRNRILSEREEAIYVDYVATDEGHIWHVPIPGLEPLIPFEATVLTVARALHTLGCTSSRALALIAERWRPIQMADDFHWQELRKINNETLKELGVENLLTRQSQEMCNVVVNEWLFPLYPLDLRETPVDIEVLREEQKNWDPYIW